MLLEEAINQNYLTLNQNEFVVLSFMKNNKHLCSNLSITDLSKRCAVSNSFIMRLSKKLGYRGFSELKYQLKHESSYPVNSEMATIETIQEDIAETFRLMNSIFFNNLPHVLHEANSIYTYGSGYGQRTILEDFRRGMIHCNKFIISLPTSKEVHLNAQHLKKGDVIIIVSMSGHVPNIEKDISEMISKDVKVISITEFKSNPLASLASDNLYIQSSKIIDPNPKNNYTSYTTLTLLLDTIVKFYLNYQRQANFD